MKTFNLRIATIKAIAFSIGLLMFESLQAQKGVPEWAPDHGYRVKTRHIYFPENNFYYDTHKAVYIFKDSDRWISNTHLPTMLAGINLKEASKVQLRIDTDTPQQDNEIHLKKYKNKKNPRINGEQAQLRDKSQPQNAQGKPLKQNKTIRQQPQ
jgi:hypothetical protein